MIIKEFYGNVNNINLYRNYSDKGFYIIQQPTGLIYEDAVDVENTLYTYIESDKLITRPEEEEKTEKI